LSTPDYQGMDPNEAVEDFRERRRNYESVYETLDASDGSYIKIYNCKKFVINNIRGYLPLKVRLLDFFNFTLAELLNYLFLI